MLQYCSRKCEEDAWVEHHSVECGIVGWLREVLPACGTKEGSAAPAPSVTAPSDPGPARPVGRGDPTDQDPDSSNLPRLAHLALRVSLKAGPRHIQRYFGGISPPPTAPVTKDSGFTDGVFLNDYHSVYHMASNKALRPLHVRADYAVLAAVTLKLLDSRHFFKRSNVVDPGSGSCWWNMDPGSAEETGGETQAPPNGVDQHQGERPTIGNKL